jgi:hypothetical protein
MISDPESVKRKKRIEHENLINEQLIEILEFLLIIS